jgi:hypothetical protein
MAEGNGTYRAHLFRGCTWDETVRARPAYARRGHAEASSTRPGPNLRDRRWFLAVPSAILGLLLLSFTLLADSASDARAGGNQR